MTEHWLSHSAAEVDSTTIVLWVPRTRLEALVRSRGVRLGESAGGPPDRHPLVMDLWRVSNGHLTIGGVDTGRGARGVGWALAAVPAAAVGSAMVAAYGGLLGLLSNPGPPAQMTPAVGKGLAAVTNAALGAVLGAVDGARAAGEAFGEATARATDDAIRRFGGYHEALLTIPCVAAPGLPACQLVLGMYTDSSLSIFGQDLFGFGLGKELASVQCDAFSRYDIRALDGTRILRTTWVEEHRWSPASAVTGFQAVRDWSAQPLLGVHGRRRPVVAKLERLWADHDVRVCAAQGRIRFGAGILPGVVDRSYVTGESGGDVTEVATFHARAVPVRLSFPRPISGLHPVT